jgi:phosphopantothenoylcysteine synthetase/decarboxylase
MNEKNLDMVVANPVEAIDAEYVSAVIIKENDRIILERVSKRQLAASIIREVVSLIKK